MQFDYLKVVLKIKSQGKKKVLDFNEKSQDEVQVQVTGLLLAGQLTSPDCCCQNKRNSTKYAAVSFQAKGNLQGIQ